MNAAKAPAHHIVVAQQWRKGYGLMLIMLLLALAGLILQPSPDVPEQAVYTGAYLKGSTYGLGDAPWDDRTIEAFENNAGKRLSILHWGQAWYWSSRGGYQEFEPKLYEKVRQRGTIPMVNWNSWDLSAPNEPEQPDFQLRDIIDGRHDAYIREWARGARDWGYPFFVRFNHEMNGDWYPWSERRNGNSSGEYARAWRHVHDLFRGEGASNVTWVWCPNTIYSKAIPLEGLYPGDAYVDWMCMDQYNWGTNPARPGYEWETFDAIFRPTYDAFGVLAPNKPIMIGETSSTEHGGSKAEWIRDALTVQLPLRYPRIKAWVWFNWNHPGTGGNMDYVIESSAASQQAYRESMASPYYAANSFGNLPQYTKVQPLMPDWSTNRSAVNQSFEQRDNSPSHAPWAVRNDIGASFSQDDSTVADGSYSMKVSVPRAAEEPWAVQLRRHDQVLVAGRTYTVSFAAKASSERYINVVVQKAQSPYTEHFNQCVGLDTSWQRYSYRFTASADENAAMLALNLAQATGDVWIDDVSLVQE